MLNKTRQEMQMSFDTNAIFRMIYAYFKMDCEFQEISISVNQSAISRFNERPKCNDTFSCGLHVTLRISAVDILWMTLKYGKRQITCQLLDHRGFNRMWFLERGIPSIARRCGKCTWNYITLVQTWAECSHRTMVHLHRLSRQRSDPAVWHHRDARGNM